MFPSFGYTPAALLGSLSMYVYVESSLSLAVLCWLSLVSHMKIFFKYLSNHMPGAEAGAGLGCGAVEAGGGAGVENLLVVG